MKSFVGQLASMHGGLWQIDPWYQRAWFAAPLAVAVLLAGWVVIEPAAAPGNAPWWKPAAAPAPLPQAQPQPQPQAQSRPPSEAARNCTSDTMDVSVGITACTQALTESGLTGYLRANLLTRRGYLYGRLKQTTSQLADYDEAIKADPNHFWALTSRGSVKFSQKDFDAAMVDLNKAVATGPNFAPAWASRGDTLFSQKKYTEAISDLSTAIRLDGAPALQYWKRGRSQQELGFHDAAIRDFNEYLKRVPNDAETLRNRASSYISLKKWDEAFADVNEALRLNPKDTAALGLRAYANFVRQQYGQTISDATEALQNDLSYIYGNQIRGRAKVALGQYASAIPDLNVAIRANPMAELYIDRGKAMANTGAQDAALRDYREAARIDPRSATAQYQLGIITERIENDRVRRCRAGPAGMSPQDLAREPIGGTCSRDPNYSEALDYYSRAVELNANFAAPHFDRGRIYLATAQVERARAEADAGLALDSRDINGFLLRGLVLSARERWNDALDDFTTAIRINPQSADAYYNRANVYIRINDRQRAISDLRAAVDLNSNYEDAKRLLRSLGQRI